MGLSTSYSKAESDIQLSKLKQLFGSGLHDKPLKISDPTPTALGGYVLSDVGNYSFGTTEAGKWNVGFLSTSGWEIIAVQIGSSGLASDTEFRNKLSTKSISSAQLFNEVIGDFNFNSSVVNVEMIPPFSGFDISASGAGNTGTDAEPWYYDHSMFSNFDNYTSIDIFYGTTWVFNIFIYAKNDLSAPLQTIPVSVNSIGIKTIQFSNPVNATLNFIAVGAGVRYSINSSVSKAWNFLAATPSNIVLSPTVVLHVLVHGTKTNSTGDKKITKRLSDLELSTGGFTNFIYKKKANSISNILAESNGSSFIVNSEGLLLSSVGNGNGVTLEKQTNLNQRCLELNVRLKSNTVFYVGSAAVETNDDKGFAVIDCINKKLDLYNINSMSTVAQTINFDWTIDENRDYIIRYYKLNDIVKLALIDTITAKSVSVEVSQYGVYDKPKFGVISSSGSVLIKEISLLSVISDRPFIVFYGDSITEGDSTWFSDPNYTAGTPKHRFRFANLIGAKLGKPYLVSGRSAGTILGVLERMKIELPTLRPKYVFVTIGTNGLNTNANLNALVDYCESLGIEVILNLIPLYDGSTAAKNAIIQTVVNDRSLKCVQMNRATSINGDGVTKDNSLFANEGGIFIHPNIAGNQKIYERALVDIADVLIESGSI